MDPAHASAALSSRHLVFDRDNFADFWAALTVRVRRDNYADLVYSGEFAHPLLAYQQTHAQLFQQHGVPVLTAAGIDMDPSQDTSKPSVLMTGFHIFQNFLPSQTCHMPC